MLPLQRPVPRGDNKVVIVYLTAGDRIRIQDSVVRERTSRWILPRMVRRCSPCRLDWMEYHGSRFPKGATRMLRFSLGGMKFARYTRVPRTPYSHSSHTKDFTCWVDRTLSFIVVRALYVAIYGRFKGKYCNFLFKSCAFFENRIER